MFSLIASLPLSPWTLMTSFGAAVSFHRRFIRSPVAVERFFSNPLCRLAWVCMRVGLLRCRLGRAWTVVSDGKAQSQAWITWKRHVRTSPAVTASLVLTALFISIYFGEWISTGKTTSGNGWVFVQRKVKAKCAFQQGSPFRVSAVVICFLVCPCSLKLWIYVFSPWCRQCAWEHGP